MNLQELKQKNPAELISEAEKLGIENGTCKATILIETLPAAFQMDEILYELKVFI